MHENGDGSRRFFQDPTRMRRLRPLSCKVATTNYRPSGDHLLRNFLKCLTMSIRG